MTEDTKQETRDCQSCKQPFVIESDDFAFYERVRVPAPTFCPSCREQRRIAFRNERALYRRMCGLCGQSVISRVSPDKPYPMYCNRCWWGDGWDPLSYGRPYNFSRPFFEQFRELLFAVPHWALGASNNVNSDWVNQETDDKNCYLNVGGHYNEDSGYNTYELYGKDSFDNFWLFHGELCYECLMCERSYRALYSRECFDCRDIIFCFDCRNCSNCIGCAGLRNARYHIFNKPVSKEEYEVFLAKNRLSSRAAVRALEERALGIWLAVPHRERMAVKCVNVSGNAITESKNAHDIWSGEKMEECKHMFIAAGMKDSYDGTSIGWGELCYEGAHGVGIYGGKFFAYSMGEAAEKMQGSFFEYCYATCTGDNCFGCVGVRNKQYCVLNREYSKEEYESLVPKIREHMMEMPYTDAKGRVYRYGEFFPIELSPFGYNETAAMDYFPLSRTEALNQRFPWSDYTAETPHEFSKYEIPDDTRDGEDDITEKVLKCDTTGRAYKIIPMELAFYRRMGIPIPRRAPLTRHENRIQKLLPRTLFDRVCECGGTAPAKNGYTNTTPHHHGTGKCSAPISTPYAPDRPELIYCEACYNAEVV